MGTAHEWIQVSVAGVFFGGFMGFFGWLSLSGQFVKPSRLFVTLYCLGYAFGGLGFGIGQTFGNRSFRPPLLLLQGAIFGCMFVLALYIRKVARSQARLPFYSADSPLFGRTDKPGSAKS
jgi:hypothetical protein